MSRHSFDPEIAKRVGLNAAVIYQNILWWAEKNAANGRHHYDGLWWTYNSVSAFSELFPYLTGKQIRTALDKLVQEGLLVTERFNKSAYDQTKWYAPTCLKDQADLPKQANETAQKGEPIPDSKPDKKPVSNIYNTGLKPESVSDQVWKDFLEVRKAKKAPLTATGITRMANEAAKAGWTLEEAMAESVARGWQSFKAEWIKDKANGNTNRNGSIDRRSSLARAIDEGLDFLG